MPIIGVTYKPNMPSLGQVSKSSKYETSDTQYIHTRNMYSTLMYRITHVTIHSQKLLVTSADLPDGRARAWASANKKWIRGISLTLRT